MAKPKNMFDGFEFQVKPRHAKAPGNPRHKLKTDASTWCGITWPDLAGLRVRDWWEGVNCAVCTRAYKEAQGLDPNKPMRHGWYIGSRIIGE